MKDKIYHLETKTRIYPFCFNLNVMEELQEKYGSITAWGKLVSTSADEEPKIKELIDGLNIMINEAIEIENEEQDKNDSLVSLKQTGRIISEVGLKNVLNLIMGTAKKSTETDNKEKNV